MDGSACMSASSTVQNASDAAAVASDAAAGDAEEGEYRWPPRSCARMRAGLRSALKTDCSGFKFQNGGRSLSWFRAHPCAQRERARLFWQGHVGLFQRASSWDVVQFTEYGVEEDGDATLWDAFDEVDSAFRARYGSFPTPSVSSDIGVKRPHARALLADGCVERAMRWALDEESRSGMDYMIDEHIGQPGLLALALEGGWSWLLRRWQAAASETGVLGAWWESVATNAIHTGMLCLVQKHWAQAASLGHHMLALRIGRAGSVEVLEWVTEHRFYSAKSADAIMIGACEFGHLSVLRHLQRSIPPERIVRVSTRTLPSAAYGGYLDTVEWLLSQGVHADRVALELALERGHYPVARYLHESAGVSNPGYVFSSAGACLRASQPYCLALLEYVTQHFGYVPASQDIVDAAMASNVRSDVLRFLATHTSQDVWDHALSHRDITSDLGARDLLHAAARDAGRA